MAAKMVEDGNPSASRAAEAIELPDSESASVPVQYRGTEADVLQMKVLGRTQEVRRVFTFVSMLGFGSTLMVTWVRYNAMMNQSDIPSVCG